MNDQTGRKDVRLSEHLANERTYLAYVRTTIALISFGITINRFSLFLLQSQSLPSAAPSVMLVDTERLGFGMVIVGILILVWAAVRYDKINRQIDSGGYTPNRAMIWFITICLLGFGAVSVVWLFQR